MENCWIGLGFLLVAEKAAGPCCGLGWGTWMGPWGWPRGVKTPQSLSGGKQDGAGDLSLVVQKCRVLWLCWFFVARWRLSGGLLGSRAAVWCCVGAAVPPDVPGEEGGAISPSLMARQGQTHCVQEHPVQKDVKTEAVGQQGATWEQNVEPERSENL